MAKVPSSQAYLELLSDLASLNYVFIMGGFAEDALLEQRITRARADLDLLVEISHWDELRAQLQSIGITRFEPLFSAPTGEPLAFGSDDRGVQIEVWLAGRLNDGYTIGLPGGASDEGPTFFRLHLPADTFQFPRATLDGVPIQTISLLALSLFRATSANTRGKPEKRLADLAVLERLVQRFSSATEPNDLIPELREFLAL